MIALCHLPSLSLAHLQRALPPPHTVANTASWDALLARIGQRSHDVVVIDPCAGEERLAASRLRGLADVVALAPPSAVVGYVSVTATAIRAVHALSRLGASEIVIRGVDDGPSALASAVQRAVAVNAASRLIGSVGASLERLPPTIAAAVELMFRTPDRLRSVSALASEAKTTRRSLDRWLARAGLAPARTLLACARTNAVVQLIAAGRLPRSKAAAATGYSSPRSVARELRALTGYSLEEISGGITDAAFVAALSRRLLRSSSNARVAASSY